MIRARVSALLGSALALVPTLAVAQAPQIAHHGVGCVVAGRFPRLEATIAPPAAVGRLRVYFRAEASTAWYFVEMAVADGTWTGVLPQPTAVMKTFSYYLEATGTSFESGRTAEYSPRVVGSSAECEPRAILAGVSAAGPGFVGAPPGARAVPPGFTAVGPAPVTGAAPAASAAPLGGGSTGLVLGIVGGAAAIGGGLALAAGSSDKSGSSAAATGGSGASSSSGGASGGTVRPPQNLNLGLSNGCQLDHGSVIYAGDVVTIIRGTCQWTSTSQAQSELAQSAATITVDSVPIGPVRYRGPYLENGSICAAADADWTALSGHHVASGTWTMPGSPWHSCAMDVQP